MESKAISIEDLIFLEGDLSREEIISILFLLYGDTDPEYALKTSINNPFDVIRVFARETSNWKSKLIDALSAIGAFECMKNLGVSIEEARQHLRNECTLNPNVKLLYEICESLNKEMTDKFISYLRNNKFSALQFSILEPHLLFCIINGSIKIDSDFSIVINFFESDQKTEEIDKILQRLPMNLNMLDNSSNNPRGFVENLAAPRENIGSVVGNYRTNKMLVLIINQEKFHRETNQELQELLPEKDLRERRGTQKDLEALKKLFDSFGYDVVEKNNLTHMQIIHELVKVTKMSLRYDGLFVCLLSHGYEGLFYGSNSIPVMIKNVKDIMSSESLLKKPKILIIQACQGALLQQVVTKQVNKFETDEPPKNQKEIISGLLRNDFLTFWSTIEGFASIRHIEKGSWFIQELVKRIYELHGDHHLVDICHAVNYEISLKRGYEDTSMSSKVESTFLKVFRFPKIN